MSEEQYAVENDVPDWTGAKTVREAWNRSPLLASVRAAREHACCACFTHNDLPCCNAEHSDSVTRPGPTS
jgi:hypothetical protein